MRRHRLAMIAGAAVAAIVIACVVGPWLAAAAGVDGTAIDTQLGATPPDTAHWLGTDTLGRDVLVRVLIGGRIALGVAAIATALTLVIGVAYGAVAAYTGGWVDAAMMRIVDALYGFPVIALAIVVVALARTRSLALLVAVIAAVSWLTVARIVRGQVLALRDREFVVAARALGMSPARVLARHVVPNAAGPVIVYATIALPQIMLTEAFLSFLGLGVQAPLASWGTLVTEGSANLVVYPWLLLAPAGAIAIAVLALSFLGDGLRDVLARR